MCKCLLVYTRNPVDWVLCVHGEWHFSDLFSSIPSRKKKEIEMRSVAFLHAIEFKSGLFLL